MLLLPFTMVCNGLDMQSLITHDHPKSSLVAIRYLYTSPLPYQYLNLLYQLSQTLSNNVILFQSLKTNKNNPSKTLNPTKQILKTSHHISTHLDAKIYQVQLSFTKIGHDVAQLSSTDETIAIAIENLEGFNQLFFRIGILHLARHQGQEFWEINGSIAICIHLSGRRNSIYVQGRSMGYRYRFS